MAKTHFFNFRPLISRGQKGVKNIFLVAVMTITLYLGPNEVTGLKNSKQFLLVVRSLCSLSLCNQCNRVWAEKKNQTLFLLITSFHVLHFSINTSMAKLGWSFSKTWETIFFSPQNLVWHCPKLQLKGKKITLWNLENFFWKFCQELPRKMPV